MAIIEFLEDLYYKWLHNVYESSKKPWKLEDLSMDNIDVEIKRKPRSQSPVLDFCLWNNEYPEEKYDLYIGGERVDGVFSYDYFVYGEKGRVTRENIINYLETGNLWEDS